MMVGPSSTTATGVELPAVRLRRIHGSATLDGASRAILLSGGAAMSEQTCTRDELAADGDARQTQVLLVRA